MPPEIPLGPDSPNLGAPTTVIGNLNKPWDIAFLPGATGPAHGMLFTENDDGTVMLYTGGGGAAQLLLENDVDTTGEGGMMGIAVHPAWPTVKQVFVCYTSLAGNDNRVVRYEASVDASGVPISLVQPTPIVTGMAKAAVHNGCRIRFQPGTTYLFVTMGDASIGTAPQNDADLNGKVLRVDADGNAVADNLSGRKWFTKGHRNPQGITFDPGDDFRPWTAEHGPSSNDEVNKLANGGNAGWDPVPGYNQAVPMTDLAKFPTALLPQWRSGDTFTIAPSGLTFVEDIGGESWGSWAGSLIMAMLKEKELRVLFVDENHRINAQALIYDGPERLRVPVQGPDGKLYVATDANPGRIFVLDPA